MMIRPTALFAICLQFVLHGCGTTPHAADLAVNNVTIYTGQDTPAFVGSVAVRDGRFVSVSRQPSADIVATQVVDGSGQFLTPGLWDAHAHTRSSEDGGLDTRVFLKYGITALHDLGGYPERIQQLQREMTTAPQSYPAIYPVYFMLNGESFAGYQHAVIDEAEVISAIDQLVSAGAAQVKIHRALSPELLPVVISQAHAHGLKVTGHIPLGVHPLDACRMGMDSVEHVGSFMEALMSTMTAEVEDKHAAATEYLLSDAAQPLYDCLRDRQVFVTPTLVIYPQIARRRAGDGPMPQELVQAINLLKSITRRLYEEGIPLLSGTDSSDLTGPLSLLPGASLHEELHLLESAGIPPAVIITMATRNAALAIGSSTTTGTIETGKAADFLLLAEDPGASMDAFQSITAVYRLGQPIPVSPQVNGQGQARPLE